jgi:DNA-binding IscR family transcriptional regulator
MHAGDCSVRLLWRTVQNTLDGILEKTTLRDLLRPEPDMREFLKTLPFQAEAQAGQAEAVAVGAEARVNG